MGQWEFVTFALPIDSAFRVSEQIKIYVSNFSESAVHIKDLDVSFRPAYLAPYVKAKSER